MLVIKKRPRAQEDDSIAHADAFIDNVDAKLRILAEQPMIGRAREELAAGLRSFAVGRYVLFYEVIVCEIVLVRVLHSARDTDPQFESE